MKEPTTQAGPVSERELDLIRLRLGGGESCLRVEAKRLGWSTAELKQRLYPYYVATTARVSGAAKA